jgi:DNA-binding IclR family transcriptional regulator
MTPTQRKNLIRRILKEHGGECSVQEISKKTGLHVNGLSQTLGVMPDTRYVEGKGKNAVWRLCE